eukprot:2599172-Amphidinium_carterae.1
MPLADEREMQDRSVALGLSGFLPRDKHAVADVSEVRAWMCDVLVGMAVKQARKSFFCGSCALPLRGSAVKTEVACSLK